jgi:hypothetical protein
LLEEEKKICKFVSWDSMMAKRSEEKAISFSNGIW